MAASLGDAEVKARADLLVAELAKCQKALGSGYLSAFPEEFCYWKLFGTPLHDLLAPQAGLTL